MEPRKSEEQNTPQEQLLNHLSFSQGLTVDNIESVSDSFSEDSVGTCKRCGASGYLFDGLCVLCFTRP